MKHIFVTLLIALEATAAATAQSTQRYELKVNDFTELRVDNHIPVDYRCNPDSAGYAVFNATDAQADWVIFDNNGRGKLSIQTDNDYQPGQAMPHITVYSASLKRLSTAATHW